MRVNGYNNYDIDENGIVTNTKRNTILKPCKTKAGYHLVVLCENGIKKTYYIHQLVAMAFLNHVPCGHTLVVNHKDFNKDNNHKDNLEVITQRENTTKSHLESKSKYVGVRWCKRINKWKANIYIKPKRVYLGSFINEYDAHLAYQNKLATL